MTPLCSYIYVIEKEFKVDETTDDPPLHLIKIGMSRHNSRGPAPLMDARTYLVSFLVHRIYLFEQYDFDGKKHAGGDTYARLAEQALHAFVEERFLPAKMRVEFPGSFDGDSVSEWFVVDPAKRKQFLDFLDKKVYYDVLVPPIHGTAFTKTSSKKIKMQPQSRGVGFKFVDGTISKTSTFRKAVDKKYARTKRARMAADRMALKGREKKKKKAEARAKYKKTKQFWESVFVGKEFLDRSLADGRQVFTELRQYKELDADLAVKDQLVVFFEPVRKTRRSDPGGYALLHDALEALKLGKDPLL